MVYLASAAFGAVLIAASVVTGHGHSDAGGGDAGGAGGDAAGGDGGGDGAGSDSSHGPFAVLGLRFFTFGTAFFGITGIVLTALGAAAVPVVAAISAVAGVGAGYGAARIVGDLMRRPVGALGPASSQVGRQGRLLLPVAAGQRGKVRLQLPGGSVDLVAEAFSDPLPAGTPVVVVELRGTVAAVEALPALPPATDEATNRRD
jgi:hypothetical protein